MSENEKMVKVKDELVKKIHERREEMRKQGKWVGGPLPYGYDCWRGILYVNEYQADILKMIYEKAHRMTIQDIWEEIKDSQPILPKPIKHYKSDDLESGLKRKIKRSALYRMFEPQRIHIYLGRRYGTPILTEDMIPTHILEKYHHWVDNVEGEEAN